MSTTPKITAEFAPWHQYACAEASIDKGAAIDIKTGALRSVQHSIKTGVKGLGRAAMQAVLTRTDRMWDNGTTLTYSFMTKNPGTKIQQDKVKAVIPEWEKYANIHFKHVENDNAIIRITFDPTLGSWSFVGKEVENVPLADPTMNLGWISGRSTDISPDERGVILHEFGHTLGLMHEHQSLARADKLTLKEDAVIEYYTTCQAGWSEADVRAQIIDVYNKDDVSNFSELDTKSIMMYFMPREMNVEDIEIKPNNELSPTDKAFSIINYPPPADAAPADGIWTLAYALDIAHVDESHKKDILSDYQAATPNWKGVRFHFNSFCMSTRIAHKFHSLKASSDPDSEIVRDWCGCKQLAGSAPPLASRGVSSKSKLWSPGETITFTFLEDFSNVTEYRKTRVRETINAWQSHANLIFKEVPPDPNRRSTADVRIFFDDNLRVSDTNTTRAWSLIGTDNRVDHLWSDSEIDREGGNSESSVVFGAAIQAQAPVRPEDKYLEGYLLYHELGHVLGLHHEHESPISKTGDKPEPDAGTYTPFDEKSVMLYADKKVAASSCWTKFKNIFNPKSSQFNYEPSAIDRAFVGVLYPAPAGAANDHFEKDIATLKLQSIAKELLKQRAIAFNCYAQKDRFQLEIGKLRDQIQNGLVAVVKLAQKSLTPLHAITPTPSGPIRLRSTKPPETPTTGSFVAELVKKLSAIFAPTTGQMFALQFPGRFLQQDQYAWDTNKAGIYGPFVKPTVVNESEFRLVDQLYNVGPVIGAPSGINLSIVYEQVLNNLVPGFNESAISLSSQQDKMRRWLTKDVPTNEWVKKVIESQHIPQPSRPSYASVTAGGPTRPANAAHSAAPPTQAPPKPMFSVANKVSDGKVNRMELAEALMQEYLTAKTAWELERDDLIRNEAGDDLEDVTRRLAHITPIREAQLAAKYSDAVVRGYSHVVRQYVGYMDIKTPAESLQDAKDALRESASSSLDGSMKVYPVQMQPIDWFKGLSTSFTMEDLTSNAELIADHIDSKSQQLDVLQTRLSVLQQTSKTDVNELRQKLQDAQMTYDTAQANLASLYDSRVISLARTFVNASGLFIMTDFAVAAAKRGIAETAFSGIAAEMTKMGSAQLAVAQASRALVVLTSQKSLAEATDTTQEITQITAQISSVEREVQELTARLKSIRYKSVPSTGADPKAPEDVSVSDVRTLPDENGTSGGSRWQQIQMSHMVSTKYSEEHTKVKTSVSKKDCNLFFGAYHSESSTSEALANAASGEESMKVEIGLRCTLVTVDRGGWFQPQFFKQANAFYHIDNKVSWSKWPESIKSMDELRNASSDAFESINKYLLPAFPVGFIICKDITIKIHMSKTAVSSTGSSMENMVASSGGCLCWSFSGSDHTQSSDKSYSFTQASDGCVIRIPGPQILGYMLQFTDPDVTEPMPTTLPDGFLIPDDEYNAAVAPTPAHGVTPAVPVPAPAPAHGAAPAVPAPAPTPSQGVAPAAPVSQAVVETKEIKKV